MKNEIFVFRTNIKNKKQALALKLLFKDREPVLAFNVDLNDHDKVLRVEASGLKSQDIISEIEKLGFICEEL